MSKEVTIRQTDLLSEVLKIDPDHYEPEEVYRFSNGKKFLNTDKSNSGIYDDS